MKKPLFLAALLCGCLLGAPVMAKQGQPGYQLAPHWTLNPSVSVGAFWESNARETRSNEKSGAGWRLQPRFTLTNEGNRTKFNVSGFYTMERGFDSDDALDNDSYGLGFGFTRELSQYYTLTLTANYTRSENDEFYDYGGDPIVDKDKTENYNANAAIGFQNSRWQWSVATGWSRTKYLEGYKHETDSINLSALAGRAIGPRTYWNVSFSTSFDDNNVGGSNDQGYYVMTGVSGVVTNRLSYNTLVGLGIYDFDGEKGSETDVGPTYNLSLAYKLNRTFALSLALSSRYEPEYAWNARNYYVWSHHLTGAVNAQWTDKWSSRLNLSWVYEDHIAESHVGERDYDRTYYLIAFNTSYKLTPNASVYGGISWHMDDYGDQGDEDNLRFDLGMTYSF